MDVRHWNTMLRAILSGCAHMHSMCVVHNDIKLDNIAVDMSMDAQVWAVLLTVTVASGGGGWERRANACILHTEIGQVGMASSRLGHAVSRIRIQGGPDN